MSKKPWERFHGRAVEDLPDIADPFDDVLPELAPSIETQQADCCVAKAAYRIVLPATRERKHPTELLLCGHHFRVGRDGLHRIKAAAFDARNQLCAIGGLAPEGSQ